MHTLVKPFLYVAILVIYRGDISNVFCANVKTINLDKAWTLRNENRSIEINNIKLPSGVYSALSEEFGDILQSKNDVDLRWISYDNWTYSLEFPADQADYDNVRSVNLTFYGIDTIASIRLNGILIGKSYNMFVRYSFDVLPFLKSHNKLEVEITSPVHAAQFRAERLVEQNLSSPPDCPLTPGTGECHRNMLRKVQTSFGGKWTLAAPSMGIWQNVLLEYFEVGIMRDIDIALRRNTTHWIMDVRAFLNTDRRENLHSELTVYSPDLLDNPFKVKQHTINSITPTVEFILAIPKDRVQPWWPNGYGAQKLYPFYFYMNCWQDDDGPQIRSRSVSDKALQIGFRTIELIEDLDDSGRTFYFKVNNVPIFMKGASYLPAHILPEANNKDRIEHILRSAQEAHMNMIRVWGGGFYETDYFYELTDYYGLLVWQDMPFSEATYPMTSEFIEGLRKETYQNAKRLAYHPSFAMIVTNDEIELYLTSSEAQYAQDIDRLEDEYKQLFMGTIVHELKLISRNDFSPRPGPMTSTPSMGVEESKKNIMPEPQNINYGDVHFWDLSKDAWNCSIYPSARFVSKYGFLSLPVMSSWNRTLGDNDNIVDLIKHRTHYPAAFDSMLELIERHLPKLLGGWEENVSTFIYFSQLAQAMAAKTATEVFRSRRVLIRTMGAIYWHLNDVWVAPSWSSIDFYGNYKLLYYWSVEFLAPTSIIALLDAKNNAINVTMTRENAGERNDPRIYDVNIYIYLWTEIYPQRKITWQTILESNNLKQRIIPLETVLMKPFNKTNCFLEFVLNQSENFVSRTYFFPSELNEAVGIMDPHVTLDLSCHYCTGDERSERRVNSCSITVYIKYPALFVYIEVNHPLVLNYKFSENGFVQVVPVKTVNLLYAQEGECVNIALEDLTVTTLNQYLPRSDNVSVVDPPNDGRNVLAGTTDSLSVYKDEVLV